MFYYVGASELYKILVDAGYSYENGIWLIIDWLQNEGVLRPVPNNQFAMYITMDEMLDRLPVYDASRRLGGIRGKVGGYKDAD